MIDKNTIELEKCEVYEENDDTTFVVGGYRCTMPKVISKTILDERRKYDKDFQEIEKLLREFARSQDYAGLFGVVLLVSEFILSTIGGTLSCSSAFKMCFKYSNEYDDRFDWGEKTRG